MNSAVAASSVTSTWRPSRRDAWGPAESFKARSSSAFRYVTITLAPSSRNARLTAMPRPPVPPATTTTLPAKLMFTFPPDLRLRELLRFDEQSLFLLIQIDSNVPLPIHPCRWGGQRDLPIIVAGPHWHPPVSTLQQK